MTYLSFATSLLLSVYIICCVYASNDELAMDNREFSFDLQYKNVHQLSANQLVIIASNDDQVKYLYFTVTPTSLHNARFLNFSMTGNFHGSFSIYHVNDQLLCSVRHSNHRCLMHVNGAEQNIGVYYMAYNGVLDVELSYTVVKTFAWHTVSNLHTYALPVLDENRNQLMHITVDQKTYLFELDNFFDVAYIWDHAPSEEHTPKKWTEIDIHFNGAMDDRGVRPSSLYALIGTQNRFIYFFASENRFIYYKFDTLINQFVDTNEDIASPDDQYRFSCTTYNERDNKIYFIGKDSHPLLMYDYGKRKWYFGSSINAFISVCSTFSIDDDDDSDVDMLLAIDTDNNIWSYVVQHDSWQILPHKLSIDADHIVSDTTNNLLYVMDSLGHFQCIQILNVTDIRCHNETNPILTNSSDAVLMITLVGDEFMVWTQHTAQSNQPLPDSPSYTERAPDDKSNEAVYDFATMIMAGLGYISVGLILISCQKKIHSKYKLPVKIHMHRENNLI